MTKIQSSLYQMKKKSLIIRKQIKNETTKQTKVKHTYGKKKHCSYSRYLAKKKGEILNCDCT